MQRRLYHLIRGVRNRHVFGFDVLAFCFIPAAALVLRLDGVAEASQFLVPIALYTLLSFVWKLAIFYPMGLYNRYWLYASVDELATVVVGNILSMAVGIVLFFGILRPFEILPDNFPRSIPILDGLLTTLTVGGFRFALRVGSDFSESNGVSRSVTKRVLIAGAGVAGSMILKELKMNPQLSMVPVGLLDDDPAKQDVHIHGVPVLGRLRDLPEAAAKYQVDEVIIAMPRASGKTIRKVVQMCKEAGVPSKTIPGMFEIIGGSATVTQIRDVEIEDLLRRGVVQTDTEGVANLLRDARVMVTGAGGSIGAELCRQISTFEPGELILLGHGENSIFNIAYELRSAISSRQKPGRESLRVHTVIADVRDRERMRQVFQHYRPIIVFHAAAHKHVGLMEVNIPDAVTNNVLGTQVLVDLAEQFGVERFVMISSDKAVNPTCIMGVTKRVAELVVHEAAVRTGRPFVSVRFGNVLGSRGSVVPIFKQQIAAGGPVLVTHPDVKRYFMTIPEAVQLVLQAATMGEGGEIFVLDMGEPIKIVDLARDLIRLSGLEEGRDIDIQFTGLQHGEKISEELFFASEKVECSSHDKILVCRNGYDGTALQQHPLRSTGVEPPSGRSFRSEVERLIEAAHSGASKNVRVLLKQLVPEYKENIAIPDIDILPLKREVKPSMSLIDEGRRS